jgi:methylated-DNA-protein-cysteine methyltransferase-like protein
MPEDFNFTDAVYDVVRLIPNGMVTSYGAIGKYLGAAKSARMVGWTMNKAHNQSPPIPAHRVVNRIGLLTGKGHFADPNKMQNLLEAEGIVVKNDQIVNFKKHFWDPSERLKL